MNELISEFYMQYADREYSLISHRLTLVPKMGSAFRYSVSDLFTYSSFTYPTKTVYSVKQNFQGMGECGPIDWSSDYLPS